VSTNQHPGLGRRRRTTPGHLFLAFASALCVAAAVYADTASKTFSARAEGAARRGVDRAAADALAAHARAALTRMPPESRLDTVEDARLRRAAQACYRAVAELADNRDAEAAAALYARFTRAYATFEAEASRRGHATCALNCKAYDEAACLKDCKRSNRRLCGCKLVTFGCVVAECLY
jgi:hypothetical protein